ncbi:tyrosyl-DNA phosphodiesterase 1 [Centruroides vittatus]|uniref:tyrosyl-DNA phosphodiesterase 1 n=1 Tax=Centruroides vittatus TaxID=120091 RepID=UPI003510CC72
MSDSDSDRTIDSDELRESLNTSKIHSVRSHSSKLHEISSSDDDEKRNHKVNKSKKDENKTENRKEVDKRPLCKYGEKCYRKNVKHREQFRHFGGAAKKRKFDKIKHKRSTFNFFLTKVTGIDSKYNQLIALNITDLLSPLEGKLKASVQFNYMIDIPWLMKQYPLEFRSCPLLIVHGEQKEAKYRLEQSAKPYPNIKFCQAKLEILYGTHHTKMMMMLYENGLRVVIHTSNLIEGDWFQKTQGMWVSPIFPKLEEPSVTIGESPTEFKRDLIDYLTVYDDSSLNEWIQTVKYHDLSAAKVFLIGSVPGRHVGSRKTMFGHLKLRKILTNFGSSSVTSDWPVIGQFSSIGSLGPDKDKWLCGEWHTSLATVKKAKLIPNNVPLKLIYPTVDNVRLSLEGYPAGGSLPYSNHVAVKQPYLKNYFYQWKSSHLGRTCASPHIKSYCRISPCMKYISWFALTSANLSKAAWGCLEKNGSQLMIRSYELGIVFIPEVLCNKNYFMVENDDDCNDEDEDNGKFFLPFDVPLDPYEKLDEPWIWNIPHTDLPDRFGNMWCPS